MIQTLHKLWHQQKSLKDPRWASCHNFPLVWLTVMVSTKSLYFKKKKKKTARYRETGRSKKTDDHNVLPVCHILYSTEDKKKPETLKYKWLNDTNKAFNTFSTQLSYCAHLALLYYTADAAVSILPHCLSAGLTHRTITHSALKCQQNRHNVR